MAAELRFTYWKDVIPHGFHFGRNAHLRNVRSWSLWLGRHCFGFQLHGFGPNP